MKIEIPKEWILSRAQHEEGFEIGAGSPLHLAESEASPSPAAEKIGTIEQRLSFGHFIALMRRRQGWTIQQLAQRAEVDIGELLVIEKDPHHEAELSTVHGLARTFNVPPRRLIKMVGLAEDRPSRLAEAAVYFAASADPVAPLTESEEIALQAYLKVVLEESDKK
jgi:transcriptional regulator with XRE-family HTH domain